MSEFQERYLSLGVSEEVGFVLEAARAYVEECEYAGGFTTKPMTSKEWAFDVFQAIVAPLGLSPAAQQAAVRGLWNITHGVGCPN